MINKDYIELINKNKEDLKNMYRISIEILKPGKKSNLSSNSEISAILCCKFIKVS